MINASYAWSDMMQALDIVKENGIKHRYASYALRDTQNRTPRGPKGLWGERDIDIDIITIMCIFKKSFSSQALSPLQILRKPVYDGIR